MASLGLAFCVVFLFAVCFSVGIDFVYLYSLESLFWWLFFFFKNIFSLIKKEFLLFLKKKMIIIKALCFMFRMQWSL